MISTGIFYGGGNESGDFFQDFMDFIKGGYGDMSKAMILFCCLILFLRVVHPLYWDCHNSRSPERKP